MQKHTSSVPHYLFQSTPSTHYASLRQSALTWGQHLQVRAWSRLRAGLLAMRHLDGKRSQARLQSCIFCDQLGVRNPIKHVLCRCPVWSSRRVSISRGMSGVVLSDDVLVLSLLGSGVDTPCFGGILEFFQLLDRKCDEYWECK